MYRFGFFNFFIKEFARLWVDCKIKGRRIREAQTPNSTLWKTLNSLIFFLWDLPWVSLQSVKTSSTLPSSLSRQSDTMVRVSPSNLASSTTHFCLILIVIILWITFLAVSVCYGVWYYFPVASFLLTQCLVGEKVMENGESFNFCVVCWSELRIVQIVSVKEG